MVKMALWFYATLSSNFFSVVLGCFCSKGMQLFCLFPRRKVAYEVKVISLHQGGVGNLLGFQKFIKKSLG